MVNATMAGYVMQQHTEHNGMLFDPQVNGFDLI